MSASWAVAGQKCVWIDVSDRPAFYRNEKPKKSGLVVTIVDVITSPQTGKRNLVIDGWPNHSLSLDAELGWSMDRFRPLVTRTQSQDLELFVPLLTSVGEPA